MQLWSYSTSRLPPLSVAHSFLWEALLEVGIPRRWADLIRLFYRSNRQLVGRGREFSFVAEVGVRQGCPLSPPICAVVADMIFRKVANFLAQRGW